jgi:predicted dehydrogenase
MDNPRAVLSSADFAEIVLAHCRLAAMRDVVGTGLEPEEVRAAGVRILSDKVDIANVRLAFPGGIVANLTASRASTEKVRKLRLFQPHQYISIDYAKQEGVVIHVGENRQIGFAPLATVKQEPLAAQFDAFLHSIATRQAPQADGAAATRALRAGRSLISAPRSPLPLSPASW